MRQRSPLRKHSPLCLKFVWTTNNTGVKTRTQSPGKPGFEQSLCSSGVFQVIIAFFPGGGPILQARRWLASVRSFFRACDKLPFPFHPSAAGRSISLHGSLTALVKGFRTFG